MVSDKGPESSEVLSWIGTIKIRIRGMNYSQKFLFWIGTIKIRESSVSAD